ncbi:MAG: hypothetical protein IM620_17560 [Cytophagales bacterium]|nr:hypothetical protein [Cytophagales bacterium]
MANNLMRIKRSLTAATPGTALSNGELAYSYNSNSMFIGAQTGPGTAAIRIGGNKFEHVHSSTPGTLGANVAIITEANSFVSNLYSVGLFVGGSILNPTTNGTHAHITRISPEVSASGGTSLGGLAGATGSNAELVTSYAIKTYVDQKFAAGGSFSSGNPYVWTAIQTFNSNVFVNTSILSVGNTTANVFANTTHLVVGNNSVNVSINSTAFTGTANNITGVLNYSSLPANVVIWSNTNVFTVLQTLNANLLVNTNSTGSLTVGNTTVNNFSNATHHIISNGSVQSTLINTGLTAPSVTIGGQITANSTVAAFGTVGNVHAPSANGTFLNMVISGNLTVSGTTTTIDTNNLNVRDNIILLANGNQAAATDVVDFGIVGIANSGVAGTNTHYGFARIASANIIQFFATNTTPGSTISTQTTMPIQAFLRPYGTGAGTDGFVVNATAIRIAANNTVSATLIANTLSLTTALPIGSGGTGQSTYAAGDLLVGGAGSLSRYAIVATEGLVLQVNASSLPQWDTLDGGTF